MNSQEQESIALIFWVNELIEFGYLHNHSRMWFASIWIHTTKFTLAIGGRFFLKHLLDGDPASNTLVLEMGCWTAYSRQKLFSE